jgi:sugar (pentulose or hexulose) kinase
VETNCTIVLDVGKTNSKLSLWTAAGQGLERRVRPNDAVASELYRALDVAGIDAWLLETLRDYARRAIVSCIIPVAHGAGAALVYQGRLFAPPLDYEQDIDRAVRAAYDDERDPFAETGSPALPCGLNLGAQLHYLEALTGPWPDGLQILPWPQYWAWRLTGVAASEITSLGCHSDLWRPGDQRPTDLAIRRGWADRMGPLCRAGEAVGPITRTIADLTNLPADCRVLCGLHDSNAALLAARGHEEIAQHDATILSTGTWFVAMRSPGPDAAVNVRDLPQARDCLINVDVNGRPAPSARFMGGRESELMAGIDIYHLTANYDPAALIARLPDLIAGDVMGLPSFVPGVGPFPSRRGQWINEPASAADKRAALGLYLALMADACLDLIGSRERLLIEGRFAEAEIFVRALASLRPKQKVYVSNAHDDVPHGALRLIHSNLKPASALIPVQPLDLSLDGYQARWRERIEGTAA